MTISAKSYGYFGYELGEYLTKKGFVPEFFDLDFLTLMFTPEIADEDLKGLFSALFDLPKKEEITSKPPILNLPKQKCSIREAVFSTFEMVDLENALGRISASPTVGCPPAVPIVMSGEEIDQNAIDAFEYYGIKKCNVVK